MDVAPAATSVPSLTISRSRTRPHSAPDKVRGSAADLHQARCAGGIEEIAAVRGTHSGWHEVADGEYCACRADIAVLSGVPCVAARKRAHRRGKALQENAGAAGGPVVGAGRQDPRGARPVQEVAEARVVGEAALDEPDALLQVHHTGSAGGGAAAHDGGVDHSVKDVPPILAEGQREALQRNRRRGSAGPARCFDVDVAGAADRRVCGQGQVGKTRILGAAAPAVIDDGSQRVDSGAADRDAVVETRSRAGEGAVEVERCAAEDLDFRGAGIGGAHGAVRAVERNAHGEGPLAHGDAPGERTVAGQRPSPGIDDGVG